MYITRALWWQRELVYVTVRNNGTDAVLIDCD